MPPFAIVGKKCIFIEIINAHQITCEQEVKLNWIIKNALQIYDIMRKFSR